LPFRWQSIQQDWDRQLPDKLCAAATRPELILYCGIHWNKEDELLTKKVCGEFVIFLLIDSYKTLNFN
jgi:hypothetical protein